MNSISVKNHWPAIAVIVATILVYIPAIQSGFVWDDDSYVTENEFLRSAEGLRRIWTDAFAAPQFYPLVFTTFWVEFHLWGLNPLGYHVVNVLLHAFSALLLWRILAYLKAPGAWFAAFVFALHPVQVESVAWITERKNVLSGVLYLGAGLCMLNFFGLGRGVENRRIWCAFGVLLFIGALLSKTITCSLPAALALILWWKRGTVRRDEILALLPLFVIGLGLGLLTAWLERHHVGAFGPEWDLTLLERALIAGRALWFYAGKLVFPTALMFNYPRWEIDVGSLWPYVYPAAAAGVVLLLWAYRRRIGRGPLAGVLFFCGTLSPAIGFFDVYPFRYSFVADHFQYHASIGLIALFVAAAILAMESSTKQHRVLKAALAIAVLGALGAKTWRQQGMYKDIETLWRETIRLNGASWMALDNLGIVMEEKGDIDNAIACYREALVLNPEHFEAHNNLANALLKTDNLEEALSHYREALRLNPLNPGSHRNLALALEQMGRDEEASQHYQEALRIAPEYVDAIYDLGRTYERLGRTEDAAGRYASALQLNPNHAPSHNNLGRLLFAAGRSEEAIQHFRLAVALDPNLAEAHYNLGNALGGLGDFSAAIEHFQQALRIRPDYPEASSNLALMFMNQNRGEEAIACLQRVVQVRPDFAQAYVNLGAALAAQGKLEEAEPVLQKASGMLPGSTTVHRNLGLVYWSLGKKEAAKREYELLKSLDEKAAAELLQRFNSSGSNEK